jgi:hypothetical protein
LQKTVGTLHIELAQLQQTFSELVERLIDDQKPFKHASRDALSAALTVMQDVGRGLKGHEGQLVSVNKKLEKVDAATLASINKMALGAVSDIKSYAARVSSCQGLKLI